MVLPLVFTNSFKEMSVPAVKDRRNFFKFWSTLNRHRQNVHPCRQDANRLLTPDFSYRKAARV
jgi:hypothetical protein